MNIEVYNRLIQEITSFPQEARLLAVTKYSRVEEINDAINMGVDKIGENRVDAAGEKFPFLVGYVEKHFIGVIQTKKIRKIVELFDVIQSVGTLKHLKKIDEVSSELGKEISVYLQFNISDEEQKSGFKEKDLLLLKEEIKSIKTIKIIGIMGMASVSNEERNREEFRFARKLRDNVNTEIPSITELSIGMSKDYKIALEEGATLIRVGSKLFR